jgi:hypothetical protein
MHDKACTPLMNNANYSTAVGLAGVLGLSGEESEVEEWIIASSSGVLILRMMYFLRNR